MGKEYLAGIKNGFSISMNHRKVPFSVKHLPNYCKIQLELWENMFRQNSGIKSFLQLVYGNLI